MEQVASTVRDLEDKRSRLDADLARQREILRSLELLYQEEMGGPAQAGLPLAGVPLGDLGHLSIAEASRTILELAGRPMKVAEILEELKKRGRQVGGRQKYSVLSAILSKRRTVFKRVGPGLFSLLRLGDESATRKDGAA